MDSYQRLLTIEETASYLNVSKQVVYRLINNGHLKSHKIGPRLWRVSESDLVNYLQRAGFGGGP